MTSFTHEINKHSMNLTDEEYNFYLDFINFCEEQGGHTDVKKTSQIHFKVIKKEKKPLFAVIKPYKRDVKALSRVQFCHKKRVFNNKFEYDSSLNKNSEVVFSDLFANQSVYSKGKGTPYRGVSKNGNRFQVILFIQGKKRYVGTYATVEEAARTYDKLAIVFHGLKARTNYKYTKEEYDEILRETMAHMPEIINKLN